MSSISFEPGVGIAFSNRAKAGLSSLGSVGSKGSRADSPSAFQRQRLWARAYILARRMDADMLAHLVADYLCELDHLSDEQIAAKPKPPHIPLEQAEANGPSERRKRGAAGERAKPTAKPIKKKGG